MDFRRRCGKIEFTFKTQNWSSRRGGSTPHGFHPDHRFAYVSDELSHHVSVFEYDETEGTFASIQHIDAAPVGMEELTNNVSEIRVHPTGEFLYTANRGNDSLAAFAIDQTTGKLTRVENEPCVEFGLGISVSRPTDTG